MSDDSDKPPSGRCNNSNLAENFKAIIDSLKKKSSRPRVAIFTHAHPDPDAIGSMMGLSWLLYKAFDIESDCFYHGEIAHPQNTAICNLLDPQLKRINEEYNKDQYQSHILVDTIPLNAGIGDYKIDFDVCIDHHKELPNGGYNGLVVHSKTGSCCSIIYKLIDCYLKNNFFDDSDNDSKVATALLAGIITDTDNMVSDDTTELEFEAFSKLFAFRNSSFLKQIIYFKRPKFWTDIKAAAAQEAEIDDEGYAIVGLGLIPEKDRDLIADMASEMVSWASVETAIAYAVVGGEKIEGSVRSQNSSLSVSDFCKKLGGKHGIGGGKHGKGAYRYGLAGMSIDADEDDKLKQRAWELIRDKEKDRICRMIKK